MQNYTKKDHHDPDICDGVIIHLAPDILECEVKWALESITMNKASGGDEIPVALFQIALSMTANLENPAIVTEVEKVSFYSNLKGRAMPKNVQTTTQLHSSHMLAK